MKSTWLLIIIISLLAVAPPLFGRERRERVEEPQKDLEEVEGLYAAGEYEACGELVDSYLDEDLSLKMYYPKYIIARYYRIKALISYAFREEGYREEIDELLLKAVTYDLDMDIGSAREVPFYLIERYNIIRDEFLSQYSRMTRRHSLGIFGALILEPTVIKDLSLLQPGLHYSYNMRKAVSLAMDVRFPMQLPIWESIRGQIGFFWFPDYRVEKIHMGLSGFYLFGLDKLSTYTHSLSFAGNMELITRRGLGFAGSVELLRLDLIFGLPDLSELPVYKSGRIGESFLRIVFTNINFYIFFTF